jgi:NAD(P)-dependent dehydrogenase (short-subunit alcohol dehydrogenase family)
MIFRHAFLAIQSAAPRLAARGGGSITLVGSRAGIKPAANQALYGSAKAALHHLMRVSAIEYGPAGIRVNVVAPGFVRTPRVSAALPPEVWERIEQSNPLRRAAEPQDVADAILYLSSDLARYVTGNVLSLDGAGDNPLEGIGVRMAAPKV